MLNVNTTKITIVDETILIAASDCVVRKVICDWVDYAECSTLYGL